MNIKHFFSDNKRNTWFWIFLSFAVVTFFLLPILSKDAGNSGDEEFHYDHAKNVYNYYATGGEDTTAVTVTEKYILPYYGQSVDNFAYFITHTFNIEDVYETRHLINSIFGWLAMFFAALIAYRLAGWRAAVCTFLMMFLSPRFLGHSFNNLKDLPMATGIIFGLYCVIRFLQEFPKIKWSTAILLTISIGFAISVRFAGALVIAYFGLFTVILFFIRNLKGGIFKAQGRKDFGLMLMWGLGISFVGFLLAMFLWPYLLEAPIAHFKDTMANMSKFAIAIRQLFEGSLQWSDLLSWYYTPKFILMTIPVAVISGLILFFVFCWRKKEDRFWSFVIFFAFFFPVFWIVYSKANVYGGWRHAMFAYPPMVVAAGLGFNALVQWIEQKFINNVKKRIFILNAIFAIGLLLLMWHPIRHIVKNHPYEYVYFNELTGGINKVYGNYEMDYYYHSTREASEWVLANAKPFDYSHIQDSLTRFFSNSPKIKVATWHTASVNYFFRRDTADYSVNFSRWYERGNNDWDYAIFTVTGIAGEQIRGKKFPPKNTVHTITVDEKPICIILKREDKSDYIGFKFKNEKKFDSAITYYTKALQYDDANESVYMGLIESYFNLGQLDMAKKYIDQLLDFAPNYESGNYFLGHYYLQKNNADSALACCKKILNYNVKFRAAYHLQYQVCVRKNDIKGAEKSMIAMMRSEQLDEQGVKQLVDIYKMQGLDDRAAYKKVYKMFYKTYSELGKEKEAEIYRKLYKQL